MKVLLVTESDDFSAEESLGATYYMIEAMKRGRTQGNPWLYISRPVLSGLTLGRFQNSSSATNLEEANKREIPILRRLTGGTAFLLGEGFVHIAIAVFMDKQPLESEPRQFLQKYGAILVKALTSLGLKARYLGRDVISIGELPAALLSFDIDENNIALLESIISVEKPGIPDESLDGYPAPVRESPARDSHTNLKKENQELTYERIVSAVKNSVKDAMKLDIEQRRITPLERERIRSLLKKVRITKPAETQSTPFYAKKWNSRPIEESIGYVEASVAVTQGRFLKDVNIYGDFMADSAGIRILEEKLRMCPIKRRQIALTIDDVLGAPEHVILGIRRLGSILEAIMDAAKKGVQEAEGS